MKDPFVATYTTPPIDLKQFYADRMGLVLTSITVEEAAYENPKVWLKVMQTVLGNKELLAQWCRTGMFPVKVVRKLKKALK